MVLPNLTPKQWTIVGVAAAIVVGLILFFTPIGKGEAVEVSVENAGPSAVFVFIDNTGRHGRSTQTQRLPTTTNSQTPDGLLIQPNGSLSFGMAVGMGDTPTLHVLPVTSDSRADVSKRRDCPFDTAKVGNLHAPPWHVKVTWHGNGCNPPEY